jgi:hypothetical protein
MAQKIESIYRLQLPFLGLFLPSLKDLSLVTFGWLRPSYYPQVEQNPFKNKLKGIKRKGAKIVVFLCALASLRLCVELFLNLWVRISLLTHFALSWHESIR